MASLAFPRSRCGPAPGRRPISGAFEGPPVKGAVEESWTARVSVTECSVVGETSRDVPAIRSAEPRLFLAAVAACVLPVWLAHYPPLVDLPQHAAQVRTLVDLARPDYPFRELFRVNWFTP